MSWLRLDDGMVLHPKIVELTDREFRVWIKTLSWCARYRTQGHLSKGMFAEVGLNQGAINKLVNLGLLDEEDGGWLVHDFEIYNPRGDTTAADRMRRYRERQKGVTPGVTPDDRNALRVTDRNDTVTEPRARALARAGDPSPTRNPQPSLEAEEGNQSAVPTKDPANGLPISNEHLTAKLLAAIGTDADERTPTVVRALTKRLPDASIAKVLESLHSAKADNRAAYAVAALQSEFAELAERR